MATDQRRSGGTPKDSGVRLTHEELLAHIEKWKAGAWSIAHKWAAINPDVPLEDLHNAVYLGMLECGKHFDPTRGLTFMTHAMHHVKNQLRRCIAEHRGYRAHTILENTKAFPLSLDNTGETEGATFAAMVPAREDEPRAEIPDDFWDRVGAQLNNRTVEILRLRFSGMKLCEIARRLGVSRERIRQIHDRAIATLRESGVLKREWLVV